MDCYLVTGGCGAIGSVLVNMLLAKYPSIRIVNIDALTYAGNPKNIHPSPNYVLAHGNICDATFVTHVLQTYKPTVILHLAAETHVDNSFTNSLAFTQTNVVGTHTLLECVEQYRKQVGIYFRMFLHMSTDEVYGSNNSTEPFDEHSLLQPSNPYAASKASAEMLCNAYFKSFNLPIVIARCNNAISEFQYPEKLIPKSMECILAGKKVPVHGRGESRRTFVDAYDIALALDLLLDKGVVGSVYNIGSDQEFTVIQVVQIILNKIRPGELVQDWVFHVPDRAFQDHRYWINDDALQLLGWKPTLTFEESITKLCNFFLSI